MEAIPIVNGWFTTFLYQQFSIILFNEIPLGKALTDSGKYEYALLSLEIILPNKGSMNLKYIIYSCLKGNYL